MAEIVISEFMDQAAVDDLARDWQVTYDPTLFQRPDALLEALPRARALIVRNRTLVQGAVLDAGRRLEAIGRLGVGLDNIDVATCEARGIRVLPARGANDTSVAEYVIGAILLMLRGVFFASDAVIRGEWPRERLIGQEIAGKCLGLVGLGSIARQVARRASALDMTLAAHDPFVARQDPAWKGVRYHAELSSLLAEADVISLHVPLMPATRDLIDAEALGRMKPGALLINAARGGLVDEDALVAALREGRLGGAVVDVFRDEPLSAATGARFEGVPNLVLTPHVAGPTAESNVRVSAVTASAVRRVLEGA